MRRRPYGPGRTRVSVTTGTPRSRDRGRAMRENGTLGVKSMTPPDHLGRTVWAVN